MLPTGRTSTRVGLSDKRGIPVLRTRPVLVCVAERELADAVLYSRTCLPSGKVTKPKGNPKTNKQKNIFPSPSIFFPVQMKPSILCMNRALYPLRV